MINTLIQIRSSTANNQPISLNIAEPAYSYTSNSLFIGTPLSDSFVVATRSGSPPGTNDVNATPGSGWTELYGIPVGNYSGYAVQQIQYTLTPSGTSVTWNDVADTESLINSCVIGLEIKAQPLSERLISIIHW